MPDRATYWQRLLADWERSGLSQAEFCRRRQLLITQAGNPLQTKITSDEKLMGGATPTFAAGARPMDPEQARKMLESMGIDLDEIMKNSVQTGGGDPPQDK